jgi:hypothetical protein
MLGSAEVVTVRAVRVDSTMLAALQRFVRPGGAIFLFGTGALVPDAEVRSSQLEWEGAHSLLPALNSVLVIYRKAALGSGL